MVHSIDTSEHEKMFLRKNTLITKKKKYVNNKFDFWRLLVLYLYDPKKKGC